MSPVRTVLLLGCAAALTTGCADRSSPGAPPDGGPPVVLQPLPSEQALPPPLDGLPEQLELPAPPERMFELQQRVFDEFGDAPDLGTTEVSLDRTVFTIRWYGDPPAGLIHLLDEYADAPFDVTLERTRFRQAELSAEASRLVREHSGVVTVAGPRNEGDGVTVGLDPGISDSPDDAVLASLGITSRFPLFPEAVSQPVPAAGGAGTG